MRPPVAVLTWALTQLVVSAAVAQAHPSERPLPISGTLSWNLLFLNTPPQATSPSLGTRFSGRLALRVGGLTYVGVGVGSWVRATRAGCTRLGFCGEAVENWSEAVVYQTYVQHRPLPRWPVWLRGGLGLANTSTLDPGGGVIRLADRWRVAVGAGAGADIRMGGHLYFSPSADFTLLPVADGDAQELRHALALGLGLTIR